MLAFRACFGSFVGRMALVVAGAVHGVHHQLALEGAVRHTRVAEVVAEVGVGPTCPTHVVKVGVGEVARHLHCIPVLHAHVVGPAVLGVRDRRPWGLTL